MRKPRRATGSLVLQVTLQVTLPAFLLAGGYGIAAVHAERALREAEQATTAARRDAPTRALEAAELATRARLEAEVATLRSDAEALSAPRGGASVEGTRAGERLGRLLDRHGLVLTEERSDANAGLPLELQALASAPGLDSAARIRTRTLRFHGRYLDVLAMLEELEGEVNAVPLRVSMARTQEGGVTWTLLLWM